jgi:hypothetical protein
MTDEERNQGVYLSAEQYPDEDDFEPSGVMAEALRMAAVVLDIAEDYDVRAMTSAEMTEMAERLYEAGAVGLCEYAAMSCQPNLHPDVLEQVEAYRRMHLDPEEPQNFVLAWQQHLHWLWAHHPEPNDIALAEGIVELLQSFIPAMDD